MSSPSSSTPGPDEIELLGKLELVSRLPVSEKYPDSYPETEPHVERMKCLARTLGLHSMVTDLLCLLSVTSSKLFKSLSEKVTEVNGI